MTQLIFKDKIDQSKIDILLSLIKSWNIEAELELTPSAALQESASADETDFFAETRGMWKDRDINGASDLTLTVGLWEGRDINDKQLRERAWGTAKRQKR